MHLVFYKTNDVFVAEEKLQEQKIETEITPTPVQDKAYCGVCLKILKILTSHKKWFHSKKS